MNTHRSNFKRGDIIVFDRSLDGSGDYLVKRVIGLPKETIKITDGGSVGTPDYIEITSNSATFILDEPYLTNSAKNNTFAGAVCDLFELTLQDNQYFFTRGQSC